MTEDEKQNLQRKSDLDISDIRKSLNDMRIKQAILATSYEGMEKLFKSFSIDNIDNHSQLFKRTNDLRNDITVIQTMRKNKKDQSNWLLSVMALVISSMIMAGSLIKYLYTKLFH